jgi:hypothetical protein
MPPHGNPNPNSQPSKPAYFAFLMDLSLFEKLLNISPLIEKSRLLFVDTNSAQLRPLESVSLPGPKGNELTSSDKSILNSNLTSIFRRV